MDSSFPLGRVLDTRAIPGGSNTRYISSLRLVGCTAGGFRWLRSLSLTYLARPSVALSKTDILGEGPLSLERLRAV